ncbi:MAG: nucleotidyltransferase domain-containing protein [Nitrospirae bacterium]|nr:MAG: nucleotidyltransferase domain-containing protein [Nitrospirota bacterium]
MQCKGVLNLKNLMIENIAERLKEYFKDKEEILLAFIFGSAAGGRLTKGSDVDIAVLFSDMPNFQDVLKMTTAVSEVIGREVDMIILNNSSPVIRMQVLKNGKLIKSKDDVIYNNFYVRAVKEYDDLKHVRKEAEEKILRGRIYA